VHSGAWWLHWLRNGKKKNMWPLLGWFSGLMCVGSVGGAVAWGSNMQSRSLYAEANLLYADAGIRNVSRSAYSLNAASNRWYSAFLVTCSVEFLCFILPKLMLLHRLARQAARSQLHAQCGRALPMVFNAMAAAIVTCGVTGMVAYIVAASYYASSASFKDAAAAACDALGNDTNSSRAFYASATAVAAQGGAAVAVHSGSEAIALLLLSLAFVIVVALSAAMFRRAEQTTAHALLSSARRNAQRQQIDQRTETAMTIVDDTMQAAAQQRRRLVAACTVVLLTFPARAAFDFLNAYAPPFPRCFFVTLCPATPPSATRTTPPAPCAALANPPAFTSRPGSTTRPSSSQ
jgi:hypothetical protein